MGTQSAKQIVTDLLKRAADEKLLRDSTGLALAFLTEAKALCDNSNSEIKSPYREIVYYRWALTMLRRPGLLVEELFDIDSALAHVTREEKNFLGPWPWLYRLAVVSRLFRENKINESVLNKLYMSVLVAVKKAIKLEQENFYKEDIDSHKNLLQSHIFNAFELATFFLEKDYQDLEGLISLRQTFPDHASDLGMNANAAPWVLLSSQEDKHNYFFNKEAALYWYQSQLESARTQGKEGIFFKIDTRCTIESASQVRIFGDSLQIGQIFAGILYHGKLKRDAIARLLGINGDSIRSRIKSDKDRLRAFFNKDVLLEKDCELSFSPDFLIVGIAQYSVVDPYYLIDLSN
jgi:hypothetical protein